MRPLLTFLLLLALLTLAGALTWAGRAADDLNNAILEMTLTEPAKQIYRAKWTDADGIVQEVETPRGTTPTGEPEPVPAWVARHKEAVDGLKAAFPPAA